ncbi:MAG: hypothetical protein NT154_11420 [Verrucomicrobia bacterium]|nr:hypothetical protein [Verrucomicrobiota bacterium]
MNTNIESQPAVEQDPARFFKLIASSAAAGLGIALLAAFTGCVGYVDGGYYGGPVVVPGPSVYFWGGDYDRGHDVRVYSHRGYESRAVVHRGGYELERRR